MAKLVTRSADRIVSADKSDEILAAQQVAAKAETEKTAEAETLTKATLSASAVAESGKASAQEAEVVPSRTEAVVAEKAVVKSAPTEKAVSLEQDARTPIVAQPETELSQDVKTPAETTAVEQTPVKAAVKPSLEADTQPTSTDIVKEVTVRPTDTELTDIKPTTDIKPIDVKPTDGVLTPIDGGGLTPIDGGLTPIDGGVKPLPGDDGPTTTDGKSGTLLFEALAPTSDEKDISILSGAGEGYTFEVSVTPTGSVETTITPTRGEAVVVSTDEGFVGAADGFSYSFEWGGEKGSALNLQNLETGEVSIVEIPSDLQLQGIGDLKPTTFEDNNAGTGLTEIKLVDTPIKFEPELVDENPALDGPIHGDKGGNLIDSTYIDAQGDSLGIKEDVIFADSGNDVVKSGKGDDQIYAGEGRDTINSGAGNDTIYGGSGIDYIDASGGKDSVFGGAGNDFIVVDDDDSSTRPDADTVDGGAGADYIVAGEGDTVDGGSDGTNNDANTLYVNNGGNVSNVSFNPDGTSGVITYVGGGKLVFTNIHTIQGITPTTFKPVDGIVQGSDNDDIIDHNYDDDPHGDMVDANDAILPGDTGDMDVIEAYGGDDLITAGADDDEVYAGAGNDIAEGNLGEDLIYGEDGNDVLFGDNGTALQTPVASPDAPDCYNIDADGELCIDFDTDKKMVTEDVWFAEFTTVTGPDGMIIGDCDLVEGQSNTFNVQLAQAVTVDTVVTIQIANGTAQQAIDPEEFGTAGNITQYWWQNQAHYDWASGQSWFNGLNSARLSTGPDAQGDVTTDTYIGLGELTNDFRVFDDNNTEITGQTITVVVPAGSTTSEDFVIEGLRETSINGMNSTFGGAPLEGTENFTLDITNIGGQAVNVAAKTVDITDSPQNTYSPIAFDLNWDGEINVTGNSTAYGHAYTPGATTISFDIDADGTNENIEWLDGSGDGFLIDTSLIGAGGSVDGGALFGDQGGLFANGYEKLDLRDFDSNDELTGIELNDLAIWVDDGDGVVETGEIETLAENGIDTLSTVGTPTVIGGETLIRSETVVDAEVTGDVSYTLTGDDAQFFEIDPNTGKLTYKDGFEPDFDNPADQDGDNVYDVNVVRTCTNPASVSEEPIAIKISDPCVGNDDVIYGGNGNDEIFGQGGEDLLVGDAGNDDIYGGCDDDVIQGDNDSIGEDLDPSDGCITLIDDSPCFCLDLSSTKTFLTEDVWFASTTGGGGGSDAINGECDLTEGEDGTYSITLDSPVAVDTFVSIVLTDITANFTSAAFPEYYYPSSTGPLNNGDETHYYANSAAHMTAMTSANWGGLTAHFNNPNPAGTGTGNAQTDTIIGVANLTNDYELVNSGGGSLAAPTIQVMIPAGQTTSNSFTIETNIETMLSPVYANQTGGTDTETDESFRIEVTEIGGVPQAGMYKDVTIHDLYSYTYSPIAFDLNMNGQIDVTGSSTAYGHAFTPGATTVAFDIDNDGTNELIEWMDGSGDGLLIDLDVLAANGGVADGGALFGDEGGTYANGYVKLDLRDADGNDIISGAELDGLGIWVDDGDGVVEVGEIETLAQNGISEIGTVWTPTVVGGETLLRSETIADAETLDMVTYSISGPDAAFFEIDPDTGKLTYADGFFPQAESPQDADNNGEYEINIIRTGPGLNEPAVEPLTIKVVEDAEGGNDNLYGGLGNDDIDGDGGNDYIEGNEGNDCIDGGFGDDVIYGDDPGLDAGPAGSGGTGGGGGTPSNVTAILLEKSNVTLQGANSALYTNVGTHNGQTLNAVLELTGTAGSSPFVNLAASDNGEITIVSPVSTPLGNALTAELSLRFIYASNGQPATINAGIVFSDLDGGNFKGLQDTVLVDDNSLSHVGTYANSSVDYDFANGGLKAKGTENNPDSQYGELDSQIATVWNSASQISFDFVVNNSGNLNFGKFTDDFEFDGDAVDATGPGDDKIIGGWGNDTIYGGHGNDSINSSGDCSDDDALCDSVDPDPFNDRDLVYGGTGNDEIATGDDEDIVYGGDGNDKVKAGLDNDTIYGDAGNDTLLGQSGDDTIIGGEGADELYGGKDADTFIGATDGDCIFGGTDTKSGDEADDYDVLDLSSLDGYNITSQTVDLDGNSTSGTIDILDSNGAVTGSFKFEEIEEIVPCFTPGTMIATPTGEVAVENLKVGDKVLTRDNGMQEIQWCGSKAIDQERLLAEPKLKPVMITAGSLGNNLPEADLMVSPNHRVLVSNSNTELYFDEAEVLVAAKHLVGRPGIHSVDVARTDYIHFMFDQHEVVLSNGTWTESFQPGEQALKGIDDDQREELLSLFPELASQKGRDTFKSARHTLKAFEAKLAI